MGSTLFYFDAKDILSVTLADEEHLEGREAEERMYKVQV